MARILQKNRYDAEDQMKNLPKINSKINSKIDGKILEKFCEINSNCQKILQKAVEKNHSSMRGITRILRVARTIADLEESQKIEEPHLLEAISYRRKI
jgi:magnesium chelatase family protein